MNRLHITAISIIFSAMFQLIPAHADQFPLFTLKGVVRDNEGRTVGGAEVFIYNSPQTRRPADFISPKSGYDGRYRTELPAGHYWMVARVREGAAYGPLAIGKRHSGEAVEMEGERGDDIDLDFVVADVREMARSRVKGEDNFLRVGGRVVDPEGRPLKGVYAFARNGANRAAVPAYLSPLTGDDGVYTLYLPQGRFCVGAAAEFPPGEGPTCREFATPEGRKDIPMDLSIDRPVKGEGVGEQGGGDEE